MRGNNIKIEVYSFRFYFTHLVEIIIQNKSDSRFLCFHAPVDPSLDILREIVHILSPFDNI